MNVNQIGHIILATVSVIAIVVLQVMGKGQADLYALLGGLAGFSGQSATIRTLTDNTTEQLKGGEK